VTTRRTIAAVVLLVAVAAGVWWKVSGNRAAPTDLDAAEAALRRHDPFAARAPLDSALKAKPDDAKALLLAARAARRCDDYAAAERYLTSLDSDAARLEWALLGTQQADFGDDALLRAALGRPHPNEADILEALAKGLATAHRWPEASAILERLLKRDAGHVIALTLRAVISERFRRYDAAEADLRSAVAVGPNHAAAHASLADWLNTHGHTREAMLHSESALKIRPTAAAQIGYARALADAAKLADAERNLAEVPTAEAHVELARVRLRLNRPGDADAALERAMTAAPWNRDAPKLRLLTAKELGKPDVAKACEAKLAELTREDADLGRLTLKARDNPTDAAVRMSLWEWAKRNGQPAEELAWLSEILRVDPAHRGAHEAFADYFDRTGQPRRAALHRTAAGKPR
jgi:Tfp pilus assembly protein PilF